MKFFLYFLQLCMIDATIIKNINTPSCKNCIYYKPKNNDFNSPFSRCTYFGTKDIQTDIITYDFADLCRNNENKCGLEGKYFKEDENSELKYYLFNFIKILQPGSYFFFIFYYIYIISRK